jgi:hypothetical protein
MNLEKSLYNAINEHDTLKVLDLLMRGANPNILLEDDLSWGTLGNAIDKIDSLYEPESSGSIDIFYYLLKYGADVNMSTDLTSFPIHAAVLNRNIEKILYYKIITILLDMGANPNVLDEEFDSALYISVMDKDKELINLLINYGVYIGMNVLHQQHLCNCLLIEKCTLNVVDIRLIELLLDNGIDVAIPDENGDSILNILQRHKEKYSEEYYNILTKFLNPNNPPYLKLSEKEEDKYIIYENKIIDKRYEIYFLANKTKSKDKKYLYADNKIDAFIYWCYTHKLLDENFIKVIENYIKEQTEFSYKHLENLLNDTIGKSALTVDYFNEEGKEFATHYLTVTHWWYNYHTDFNRLYQEENSKLPREIKDQKEFEVVLKLLNIRYKQFNSKKDFNSNQNKEELEALLDGKEPRARYIQMRDKYPNILDELTE